MEYLIRRPSKNPCLIWVLCKTGTHLGQSGDGGGGGGGEVVVVVVKRKQTGGDMG